MSAPPPPASEAAPGNRTARALQLILGLQIVIALAIIVGDLATWIPAGLRPGGAAPGSDMPVGPGDQTRLFEPSRLMTQTPGFPASGPTPRRLAWEATEIDGAPALALTGAVAPGDAARFAEHLATLAEPPAVVTLHSPGGSVVDAIAIGRRLRADGIATRVGAEAACLSACPYILAGGAERRFDPGATVGVHQHYFGQNAILPAFLAVADIQRGQAEVMSYLDEMGVDPMLVAKAMQIDPSEIYILLPEELEAFALATSAAE